MAELVVYSGAGDGHVYWIQSGEVDVATWNSILVKSAGNNVDSTSTTGYAMITQNGGGSAVVARSFFAFDTSSIPDDATIDSATFSAYGSANYQDTDGKTVVLIETTQSSTSSLVLGDYSKVIKTKLSDTEIALHLSNVAYNNWPLNALGLTKINKTGFTKLGLMGNVDVFSTFTSGPVCGHSVYMSEDTGTSRDPKLVINYTLATTTSTTSSTSTTTTSSSTSSSTSTTSTQTSTSSSTTTTSTTTTSSSTTTTSSSTTTTSSSTTTTSSSTTMPFSIAVDNV